MKSILTLLAALALLGATAIAADPTDPKPTKATRVEVPDAGSLEVQAPESWSVKLSQLDKSLPPTLRMESKDKLVGLQITFITDKAGQLATKDKIAAVIKQIGAQYAGGSVEKETKVVDLKCPTGMGAIAEYTDAELVGKPTEAGKFKVVGVGLVHVGTAAAAFTLLGDAFDSPSYQQGREILAEGISAAK